MKKQIKIILLGYMASGKSTIGKSLAKSLNIPFIDLDDCIVEGEKSSISDIFSSKGEVFFRKLELIYLNEILKKEGAFVLALGGGTPMNKGAMKLINKHDSVYLKAKVKTLYQRLIPDNVERPLLIDIDKPLLKEYIKIQLKKRKPYYKKAKYTIKIDGLSLDDVIKLLVLKLNI
jgi:shikimate kinase